MEKYQKLKFWIQELGYSASNTKIQVVSSGKNAFIDPQIRTLTVNDNIARFTTGEVLLEGKDKLQYSSIKIFWKGKKFF